jgi:ferritin-like metal-binding protein YciE
MATRTISKQGRGNQVKNTADKKQPAGGGAASRQQGSNQGSGRGTQGTAARQQESNDKDTQTANSNTRSQQALGNGRQKDSQNRNLSKQGSKQGNSSVGARSKQGDSPLEKFFLDMLKDIYYAEKKITQSLPKMQEAATTDELKDAFEDHLHQTERHVKRLEKVFQLVGKQPEGKKCEAIEGIAKEVESIIEETEEGTLTRDAALIIAAQKVEHYEIATYGGLVQLAITMGLHDAADLLDKTLLEEEDTDSLLTEIAENDINLGAEHEGNHYSWDQEHEQHEGESDNEEEEDNQDKKQSSGNRQQTRQQRQPGETEEENEENETEEGKTEYSDIE